ncbi:DUF2971 domain-containing protein [Salipaludibacillus sp. CF4.18]|uniref:DUF2971 domain-containing protein n=1 Tax=Salipaludibacillus sp. CF4.18 TaxID=3373081 RepID=UPI003EE7B7D4
MSVKLEELLIKTFWEDIGPKIRPEGIPEKMYHYTSIEGLMGIIKNKKLWMTKSDFLNDSMEVIYITNIIDESLDIFSELLIKEYGKGIKENDYYKTMLEKFTEAVDSRFVNVQELIEIYVLSLSEKGDSLTLWGNYAKGDGYNIGFDSKSLLDDFHDENDDFFIVYGNVIYDREEQIEMLASSLIKTFKNINSQEPELIELESKLLPYYKSVIISYSIFFKHDSFKAEEEFRVVATIQDKADVEFRSNNGVITPYIDQEFKKLPIREITIGPKNNSDIAEKGVNFYIERLGEDIEDITVKKSNVPLRY